MKNTITANKTPETNIYFWLLNLLLTMVGASWADFLTTYFGWGLITTASAVTVVAMGFLWVQLRASKYNRWLYWWLVLLVGTFGALLVDNLTTDWGVALNATTQIGIILLVMVFSLWFVVERTLSVHSIITRRRELFYWLAVLLVFVVGTAFDEWLAETYQLSYLGAVIVFTALLVIIAGAHYLLALLLTATGRYHPAQHVLAFWLAYIFIRPLAQAVADLLSQDVDNGGLGIDDATTTPLFIVVAILLLVYCEKTKKDVVKHPQ